MKLVRCNNIPDTELENSVTLIVKFDLKKYKLKINWHSILLPDVNFLPTYLINIVKKLEGKKQEQNILWYPILLPDVNFLLTFLVNLL